MTSILTNAAAMAALQTLRMIDKNLEETQNRVSSGYRVESAADNAAYWSISTTMRSDNNALSSVQDALGLGAAKVDTAYAAIEKAIDVVNEIKKKLVAAYGVDADRPKIQEEIGQLQEQLRSISESASFSGENWLQDKISASGTPPVETPVTKSIVASFVRDSSGNISVATVDYNLDSKTVLFDTGPGNMGILDKEAPFVKSYEALVTVDQTGTGGAIVSSANFIVPMLKQADVTAMAGYTASGTGLYVNGLNGYMRVGADKWVAVTRTSPTPTAPATAVKPATTVGADNWYYNTAGGVTAASRNLGISVSTLDITKLGDVTAAMTAANVTGDPTYINEDALDVMVSFVNQQLEAMTSAASALGSIQSRIDMQEDFVSTLMDVIDKGVGRLVDADMNEESTRLKALQTQQQLGIQSLSIANSNAENILSLFR